MEKVIVNYEMLSPTQKFHKLAKSYRTDQLAKTRHEEQR